MPKAPTAEQEQILNNASAIDEMLQSPGWRLFQTSVEEAIKAVKKAKGEISTQRIVKNPDGTLRAVADKTPEDIGIEYLALSERETALRFILSEPQRFSIKADKVRKELA